MHVMETRNEILEQGVNAFFYSLPRWNVEALCGYKPKTTFWQDFSIAERLGLDAVKRTFSNAKSWLYNCEMWTELVMVLNHKIWAWYESKGTERNAFSRLYNDLWEQAEQMAGEAIDKGEWSEEEASYYFRTLD